MRRPKGRLGTSPPITFGTFNFQGPQWDSDLSSAEEGTFFNENRNLSGELESIPFTEDHRSWVRWPSVLFTNFVLKPFETLSWALEPLMSYIAAVCLFAGWLYFMSTKLPGDLLLEVFLVVLLFATVSAVVWMWDEGIIQYYLAFPDTANASAMFALTNFWFVIPRLGEWLEWCNRRIEKVRQQQQSRRRF
ncbi:hypothetical protein CSPX01_04409 [Colletotrichum filicis]|nr:hypothetical protein CSPX01_04409 [Colletotrichum filicis]